MTSREFAQKYVDRKVVLTHLDGRGIEFVVIGHYEFNILLLPTTIIPFSFLTKHYAAFYNVSEFLTPALLHNNYIISKKVLKNPAIYYVCYTSCQTDINLIPELDIPNEPAVVPVPLKGRCKKCGAPAYEGFMKVECSKGCIW